MQSFAFHTFFIIVSIDNLLIEHFQISRRFLEIVSLNIQPNLIKLFPIPLSRTLRKRKPRSRKRIARPESRDHRAPKTERRRRSKRGGGRLRTEREREKGEAQRRRGREPRDNDTHTARGGRLYRGMQITGGGDVFEPASKPGVEGAACFTDG